MNAIDRVLSAIDSGLQSSSETGYTFDRAGLCARCQRARPVEGGDLCGRCRAYLLGDGTQRVERPALAEVSPEEMAAAWEAAVAAFGQIWEAVVDMVEAVAEKMAPLLDLFAEPNRPAGESLAAKSCRPLPQSPLQLGPLRSAVLPAPRMHRVQHRR